jgi:hypothetical protein
MCPSLPTSIIFPLLLCTVLIPCTGQIVKKQSKLETIQMIKPTTIPLLTSNKSVELDKIESDNISSSQSIPINTKTIEIPAEVPVVTGKINVILTPNDAYDSRVNLFASGKFSPKFNTFEISSSAGEYMRIIIDGKRSVNYLVELEIDATLNYNCTINKLIVYVGNLGQPFLLREASNKLVFVANTMAYNGRVDVTIGTRRGASCDNSFDTTPPIIKVKKIKVQEL